MKHISALTAGKVVGRSVGTATVGIGQTIERLNTRGNTSQVSSPRRVEGAAGVGFIWHEADTGSSVSSPENVEVVAGPQVSAVVPGVYGLNIEVERLDAEPGTAGLVWTVSYGSTMVASNQVSIASGGASPMTAICPFGAGYRLTLTGYADGSSFSLLATVSGWQIAALPAAAPFEVSG